MTIDRHYILNINPQATHEWDRCVLRNPITGERPDLQDEIALKVKNQPGSYLIKVSIEVEILEQTAIAEVNAEIPVCLGQGTVVLPPTATIKANPKSQRYLSVTK